MRTKKDVWRETLFLLLGAALFFVAAWLGQDGYYAPCGERCPFALETEE